MKNSILGIFCALLSIYNVQSQPFTFTVLNGSYTQLVGSTSLNNGLTWDDPNFTIPIGFHFSYLGNSIDTILLSFGYGGTLLTTVNSNAVASLLSPYGSDLMDRGYNFTSGPGQLGSLSNISYSTIGSSGNRIFKLQWENAGFYSDIQQNGSNAQDYVNFQLWLYENNDDIEIHFGPQSVSNPLLSFDGMPGPDILLIPNMNLNNFLFGANYYCLGGQPSNPSFLSHAPNAPLRYMNGSIPNGTIYRFSPLQTAIDDPYKDEIWTVYPTPADEFIYLKSSEVTIPGNELIIRDVSGRVVLSKELINHRVSVENLKSGFYILELKGSKYSLMKKIQVIHNS